MPELRKKDRKAIYLNRVSKTLSQYNRCFVVGIDNVRSSQMQGIRFALRGNAEMVMGKNTLIKKCIRDFMKRNPNATVDKLLPLLKQNVGFVFTNGDLSDIKDLIAANRVSAPAKAGALAPCDVTIPPQATTLGPEKTSFFQALSIPTKITKGNIEILNSVPIIKEGTRVGASEATLLSMLKITPFTYGLDLIHVYENGSVFSPKVLDIKAADLIDHFAQTATRVAALSMAIGYPTLASVPHHFINNFKKLLAISVVTEIDFKESKQIKEYLKDPSKFASAAAPAAAAPTSAAPAKKEEKKPEPESESGSDIGMGLFD